VNTLELNIITSWVTPGASVLDLGCGDGMLLEKLVSEKHIHGQGIELDEEAIYRCVKRGLSVLHADIDSSLRDYANNAYDYVILKESFQQVKKPESVLLEALRIGREVIVSFPNFTHYSARLQLCFKGMTPVTPSLPYEWYNTPNLHFLSIRDFEVFCRRRRIEINKSTFIDKARRITLLPNLRALIGIFSISAQDNLVTQVI